MTPRVFCCTEFPHGNVSLRIQLCVAPLVEVVVAIVAIVAIVEVTVVGIRVWR